MSVVEDKTNMPFQRGHFRFFDAKLTLAAPVGSEPEVGLTHQVLAITLG
jgi:hypothetical protein